MARPSHPALLTLNHADMKNNYNTCMIPILHKKIIMTQKLKTLYRLLKKVVDNLYYDPGIRK